jgi:hypothetical protein
MEFIAKSFPLFFGSLRENTSLSLIYGSFLPKNLIASKVKIGALLKIRREKDSHLIVF